MTPGTEFARDFCAGIGPLQLGVVLVSFIFPLYVTSTFFFFFQAGLFFLFFSLLKNVIFWLRGNLRNVFIGKHKIHISKHGPRGN